MANKLLILCLIIFAGCSQAVVSKVVVTESRPTLSFKNAPKNSIAAVDGQRVGRAEDYNGSPKVLYVEPGTHQVTVFSSDNKKIYEQSIFVDSEHKIINVH